MGKNAVAQRGVRQLPHYCDLQRRHGFPAFDAEDCDTCAADGVLGAMAGMVGSFAAMQAIRVLLQGHAALGDPQWGKLHLFDGLGPSLRTMAVPKDPGCRACSG